MHIQSNENLGFEVFKVSKTKSLPFDVFDEFIGGFEFGIGIRKFHGIGHISLIVEECLKNFCKLSRCQGLPKSSGVEGFVGKFPA